MMTAKEIKKAIGEGLEVCCHHEGYCVIKDYDRYLLKCIDNGFSVIAIDEHENMSEDGKDFYINKKGVVND